MASKSISNTDLELIFDYLKRENRPCTPIMLFENIKRVVSKSQVLKCLDILTNDGRIICKEFGKAKVYMVNQENLPSSTDEILIIVKDLEDKVKVIKDKLLDLRNKNAILYNYSHSFEELSQLNNELSCIKSKINCKDINGNNCTNFNNYDEIGRVKLIHEKTHSEWYKRKKFCENLVKTIGVITEISLVHLIDEMGIDDDPNT